MGFFVVFAFSSMIASFVVVPVEEKEKKVNNVLQPLIIPIIIEMRRVEIVWYVLIHPSSNHCRCEDAILCTLLYSHPPCFCIFSTTIPIIYFTLQFLLWKPSQLFSILSSSDCLSGLQS